MPSPSMTYNARGNIIADAVLAASGTSTSSTTDYSTKFEVLVQLHNKGSGTVAATNGLQLDVFPVIAGSADVDTTAYLTVVLPTVVSTDKFMSVRIPGGKYQFKITNLDVTNGLTLAGVSTATVDAVA